MQLYGQLKSNKIGQLESLMEDQDRALLAAAEVRGGCRLRTAREWLCWEQCEREQLESLMAD